MIEVEIPNDIRTYESKLIGPFTTRQTICFAAGAVIVIPTYLAIREMVPTDLGLMIAIVVFLPFLLCGWLKLYGMPFEQFALVYIRCTLLAPKKRKYKTENFFDVPELKDIEKNEVVEEQDEDVKGKKKKKKSKQNEKNGENPEIKKCIKNRKKNKVKGSSSDFDGFL